MPIDDPLPPGFQIEQDVPWITPPAVPTPPVPSPAPQGVAPTLLDTLRRALVDVVGIPGAEAKVRSGGDAAPQQPAPSQAPPQAAPQPSPEPPPAQPQRPELPAQAASRWREPDDEPDIWEIEAEQNIGHEVRQRPWEAESEPAPESPTAEPVEDLIAQSRDLADPGNRRRGLYLSRANREALSTDQDAASMFEAELARLGIDTERQGLDDFDGQGGLLVVPDARHRQRAERLLARGEPVGRVVGTLIGAGKGKPSPVLPDGSPAPVRVVQQLTPDGAVAIERMVATDAEETAARRDFAVAGRSVQVVSPQQLFQRRAERLGLSVEQLMRGALPPERRPDQPSAKSTPGGIFSAPISQREAAEPGPQPAPTLPRAQDLIAQARDLADPGSRRQALLLPAATLDALADDPAAAENVAEEFERLGIGPEAKVEDIDGRGGVLVVLDPKHRERARRAQRFLGRGAKPEQILRVVTAPRSDGPAAPAIPATTAPLQPPTPAPLAATGAPAATGRPISAMAAAARDHEADGVEEHALAEGYNRSQAEWDVTRGRRWSVPEGTPAAILQAFATEPDGQRLLAAVPAGTRLGVMIEIALSREPGLVAVAFREPNGSEFEIEIPQSLLFRSCAAAVTSPGNRFIGLINFATPPLTGQGLKGVIGRGHHEVTHVLERTQMLPAGVRGRLLRRAHDLGILDMPFRQVLNALGFDATGAGGTLREVYRQAYGRHTTQSRLDSEAIAHFVELVFRR
jgi:hypothetical protein